MRVKPPSKKAHHLVHFLHVQMAAEDISRRELAMRAGLSNTTLVHWWDGTRDPILSSIEAALNTFGYSLKVTPLVESNPAKQWLETHRAKRKAKQKEVPPNA